MSCVHKYIMLVAAGPLIYINGGHLISINDVHLPWRKAESVDRYPRAVWRALLKKLLILKQHLNINDTFLTSKKWNYVLLDQQQRRFLLSKWNNLYLNQLQKRFLLTKWNYLYLDQLQKLFLNSKWNCLYLDQLQKRFLL